jgi:hypothetical protein
MDLMEGLVPNKWASFGQLQGKKNAHSQTPTTKSCRIAATAPFSTTLAKEV